MYERVIAKHNNPFPTQIIRAKSFSRELLLLLTPNEQFELSKSTPPSNYIAYLDLAMHQAGIVPTYREKGVCKKTDNFVVDSQLQNWWNGEAIPGPSKQKKIESVFSTLPTKWFNRRYFCNRFQMHLATQDLFYISSRNTKYAVEEANRFIDEIISNWRPKGRSKDKLNLSGPVNRGGFCLNQLHQSQFISLSGDSDPSPENTEKYNIKYDLSIDSFSDVGVNIAEFIANIYQQPERLSIIPYMFCLLCLGDDDGSNYKNELFIDFLSILNCARFLQSQTIDQEPLLRNSQTAIHIHQLFLQVNDYYYSDYWSVEEQSIRMAETHRLRNEVGNKSTIAIPNFETLEHPIIQLTEILEEITKKEVGLDSPIPKLLADFRDLYLDNYKISGLSEKEIIKSLLTKFTDY